MFTKGKSGNPGGRPKGLAAYVQKLAGKNGEKLIDGLWEMAFDSQESSMVRLKARRELLDRGWNKPTQGITFDEPMRPLIIDRVSESDIQQRRTEADA